MITVLSIICCYGIALFVAIFHTIRGTFFLLSILYGIISFFGMLAFWSIIVLLILLIPIEIMGNNPKPFSKFRWRLTRDVAKYSLYWLNVRVNVEGLDKLDPKKRYVFYSNHQNFMDFFVLYYGLKKFPHSELYKEEILKYPLVRGTAKSLGGVSLNRFDDREALKSIIETIKKINNGQTFLIFPEGTRTKDSYLNEYKAGSFKIAQKVDCDLVVLVIDNAYKITHNLFWKRTKVDLRIEKVISKNEFPESSVELSNMVKEIADESLIRNRKNKSYLKIPKWYLKKRIKVSD